MLTGAFPVDSVQDDWAGDDGVNVDIGLPQSYHDLPQQHRGIIAVRQAHLWEEPVWSRGQVYRKEAQSGRPRLLLAQK